MAFDEFGVCENVPACGPVEWEVADLIEDQDGGAQVGLELLGEPAGGFGAAELVDSFIVLHPTPPPTHKIHSA
jgi:hypothetical protein